MMMRSVAFIALVAASVEGCANRCAKSSSCGPSSFSSACRKKQASCGSGSSASSCSSGCQDKLDTEALGSTEVTLTDDGSKEDLTPDMVQIQTDEAIAGLPNGFVSVQITQPKAGIEANKSIVAYVVDGQPYYFEKRVTPENVVAILKASQSVHVVGASKPAAASSSASEKSTSSSGTSAAATTPATDETAKPDEGMGMGTIFGIILIIVVVIAGAYFMMAGGESEEGDETEEDEAEEEA